MYRINRVLSLAVLLGPAVGAMTYRGPVHAASCAAITTLRVTGWGESTPEAHLLAQGIDRFNQLNPCIVARYSPTTQSNYEAEIQHEFAHGTEADVFYASPEMIADEGQAGLLLKLDPYLAGDHVNLAGYIPALRTIFQIDGSTYGLPKDWGTVALLYNKDVFDAQHLPYPTNNLTYAGYRALAKQFTTSDPNLDNAIHGTAMPEDYNLLEAFMYGFGTRIFDPIGNKILFDNAQAIKALQYYTTFQLADHSALAQAGGGDNAAIDSFGAGKVAMLIEGSWRLNYLQSTYPQLHFGVAEIPIGPAGRAAPLFTNAWSASARTAHPAAAARLIAYLSGSSFQRQQLHGDFALPTLTALQADPYLKTHSNLESFFATYAAGKPANFGRYDSAVNKVLTDAVSAVLSKRETPTQAIAGAARTLHSDITGQS
jgi:multiple sugar transport system substrate-binding protein